MIGLYPLLLIWAAVQIRRTKRASDPGWVGFTAWAAAGAVFSFSLLTGFSIGLLLLPLVAVALYLAVRSAPDFRASIEQRGAEMSSRLIPPKSFAARNRPAQEA